MYPGEYANHTKVMPLLTSLYFEIYLGLLSSYRANHKTEYNPCFRIVLQVNYHSKNLASYEIAATPFSVMLNYVVLYRLVL